jgi:hypothetical protein
MLRTLVLACTPVVTTWAATLTFAWCTTPQCRGTLARRRRDLRAAVPDRGGSSGLIDLSLPAAAYALGIRVGGVVRGATYLGLVACVLFHFNLILTLVTLAAVIWIYNHWQKAANIVFYGVASDISLAFNSSAHAYQFPSHRRGWIGNFLNLGPGMTLSVVGIALILTAGLPLAYHSDSLISPIPGLYLQHSRLPPWLIGIVLFASGATIAWAGAWIEHRAQRRAMRRESRIVPRRLGKRPAAVFLRPFGSELLTVPSHPGPRRDGLSLLLPRRKEFLENVLTWLLWAGGEVVAIAQPGAGSTKTVGAAHHQLKPDTDWQAAVRKLLDKTTAIVLVPGTSSGVAWEERTVLGIPDYARKALIVNPEPGQDPGPFLATVGTPAPLVDELRQRQLRALAAISTPAGPRLLCSSLAEDIDFEIAVEWFLRHQAPQDTSFWERAQRLAVALGLDRGSRAKV